MCHDHDRLWGRHRAPVGYTASCKSRGCIDDFIESTVAHIRRKYDSHLMKQFLAIIAMCVAAAVTYGIIHDQITIRICVEYFTIGHPRIIDSSSPTLIALAWGVVATWWVGLGLGILVAVAARVGRWPKLEPRVLVVPLALVLLFAAVMALIAGEIGPDLYVPYRVSGLSSKIGEAAYKPYLTCRCAHTASYNAGAIGGVTMAAWIVYCRWRRRARQRSAANASA